MLFLVFLVIGCCWFFLQGLDVVFWSFLVIGCCWFFLQGLDVVFWSFLVIGCCWFFLQGLDVVFWSFSVIGCCWFFLQGLDVVFFGFLSNRMLLVFVGCCLFLSDVKMRFPLQHLFVFRLTVKFLRRKVDKRRFRHLIVTANNGAYCLQYWFIN